MSASTVYDVRVNYMLDDKASKAMGGLASQAKRTGSSVGALGKGFQLLSVAAAGGFGIAIAKKYLVDYNAQMDEAKMSMTAILKLNMGGTWADNQKKANSLVKQFTKDAAQGVGTTQDYVRFAQDISPAYLQASDDLKGLNELTKLGVTAARALGVEGDVAGRDIQQMLTGNLRSVDRLPKLMGVAAAEWNAFARKASPGEVLAKTMEVFRDPAIQQAATEYGKSWAGITSTLEDNIQRALGQVGMPLMKAISDEFVKWNDWLSKNEEKVTAFAKELAAGLVKAFEMAKGVIGFLVEHKGLLLMLAKAYLASKGIGLIQGAVSSFQGLTLLNSAAGTAATGLGGLASKFGVVGMALAGLHIGATAIADEVDRVQERDLERKGGLAGLVQSSKLLTGGYKGPTRTRFIEDQKTGQTRQATTEESRAADEATNRAWNLRSAKETGAQSAEGIAKAFKVNLAALMASEDLLRLMRGTGGFDAENPELANARTVLAAMGETKRLEAEAFVAEAGPKLDKMVEIWRGAMMSTGKGVVADWAGLKNLLFGVEPAAAVAAADALKGPKGGKGTGVDKRPTNINVHKIEIVSDDPDRIAFGLISAFQDIEANPVQSKVMHPMAKEG